MSHSASIEPEDRVPEWERRFRAARIGMPRWAADAPDRCVVVATAGGTVEVHCWDHATGQLTQVTARTAGTLRCDIDPTGEWVWWFDDEAGNERGVWRRQPFGSGPTDRADDVLGLPSAYDGGLALGRDGCLAVGQLDESGSRIYRSTDGQLRQVYSHRQHAWVGGLSADARLLALVHSERGDSRHPDVRILEVASDAIRAELSDGPGRGLEPIAFALVPGDQRLLLKHERRERAGLLIWDPSDGGHAELALRDGAEVRHASWSADGQSVLAGVDHEARTRLRLIGLNETGRRAIGERSVGPGDGTVLDATARPGGGAWLLWSSAAQAPAVRDLAGELVLAPPGPRAPQSVPVEDIWAQGPGGRVHSLLRRPPGAASGPLPLLIEIHGGPHTHDADAFRAGPSAWVDHGFAVVQVNYRGSTGYGLAWRDALQAAVGHVELEDIVAVRDHLVAIGVADPARVVLSGTSWAATSPCSVLACIPVAGQSVWPVSRSPITSRPTTRRWRACRPMTGRYSADRPPTYRRSTAGPAH